MKRQKSIKTFVIGTGDVLGAKRVLECIKNASESENIDNEEIRTILGSVKEQMEHKQKK